MVAMIKGMQSSTIPSLPRTLLPRPASQANNEKETVCHGTVRTSAATSTNQQMVEYLQGGSILSRVDALQSGG